MKQALGTRNVWLLALAILATNMGGYVVVFWLATVVEGLLGACRKCRGNQQQTDEFK